MAGKWTSFDTESLIAELAEIPQPDRGALFWAMDRYAKGIEVGWQVKNYGGDLYMIRANSGKSGRCLFFTIDETEPKLLVALLFYKKGADEAPDRLKDAARERRGRYIEARRKNQ